MSFDKSGHHFFQNDFPVQLDQGPAFYEPGSRRPGDGPPPDLGARVTEWAPSELSSERLAGPQDGADHREHSLDGRKTGGARPEAGPQVFQFIGYCGGLQLAGPEV